MALTPAEKQRRYRERKKEKDNSPEQKRKQVDATHPYLQQPFFEWMGRGWDDVNFPLGLIGFEIEPFTDDRGATDVTAVFDEWGTSEGYYDQYKSSIGRAELMVGCLLDAAGELAIYVNRYKREQVAKAIADIEASDLGDPTAKKRALADIVELTKIRAQLEKDVRWTLAQWKVKGE
ncbi:hypothetical protein ACSBOB_26835 [Mesorhizobium sp. ASY16-5R]|uniref:hypothetical protein n=1 Tax=Mesorhizobium sp. ASY16-5R TaxID=3445772 RepID=UPI003FA09DDB